MNGTVKILGQVYDEVYARAMYLELKAIFGKPIPEDTPESVKVFMRIADAAESAKPVVGELSGVKW